MIKEFSWYIETDRYSNIVKQLDSAIRDYASAKEEKKAETEQTSLRETARLLCEDHAVKSGLRTDDNSYINIDTEFFDDTVLDESSMNSFIKNVIKNHCYQKVLWEYMGTTGSMTEISKAEMRNEDRGYNDYLPISYKKSHPKKGPLDGKLEANTVPMYIYPDGSASDTYDSEKGKISFNILQDTSGFNWNKGYDPNDEIFKKDWRGTFDKDGTWVKVNTYHKESEPGSKTAVAMEQIKLIKTDGGIMLYDPSSILLNPALLTYLTEDGEVYGLLETDSNAIVNQIASSLKEMGLSKISEVAVGHYGQSKPIEEIKEVYRKMLGLLAEEELTITSSTEANKKLDLIKLKEKEYIAEEKALELEKTIQALAKNGTIGEEAVAAINSGEVKIPLEIINKKDAATLGLDDREEEYIKELIARTPLSEDKSFEYNNALVNIFANWDVYSKSGISKTDMADKVYEAVAVAGDIEGSEERESKESKEEREITINTEITFGDIVVGSVALPGSFKTSEVIDFSNKENVINYIEDFVKDEKLSKEQGDMFSEIIENIPQQETVEQQHKTNKALSRLISEYRHIAGSTGMPIAEAVNEAVKLSGGKVDTKFIPPVSGFVSPLKKQDAESKRVFYELPFASFVKEASKENYQLKKVSIHELLKKPVAIASIATIEKGEKLGEPVAIIGEAKGQGLGEVITAVIGYIPSLSPALIKELSDIRIVNNSNTTINNELTAIVEAAAKHSNGDALLFRKEVLTQIELSQVTSYNLLSKEAYNLTTEEGIEAYNLATSKGVESSSSKETELNARDLDKLIADSSEPVVIIGGTKGQSITSLIGNIPTLSPALIKELSDIRIVNSSNTSINNELTAIVEAAVKHSNGDAQLFRKEVLAQIKLSPITAVITSYNLAKEGVEDYNLLSKEAYNLTTEEGIETYKLSKEAYNLQTEEAYNLTTEEGVEAYSLSSSFKETGLSTKDLDKLIAGTRGSSEPVVIIGGATEGHNIGEVITSIIGNIPTLSPALIKELSDIRIVNSDNATINNELTAIVEAAAQQSNNDAALFRKEVLSQIDTNKNLSPVTSYNLTTSKGVEAYSLSSSFKETGLSTKDLDKLIAGTRGSRGSSTEPVVIIGGTKEGHNITSIIGDIPSLSPPLIKELSNIRIENNSNAAINNELTAIIQKVAQHSNNDAQLFRKEVLRQLDTNKNLSPVTSYNLPKEDYNIATSKGIETSSGSRELSTKDLDKLIAGTRGSSEPVVIIGGTKGHSITEIIGSDIPTLSPSLIKELSDIRIENHGNATINNELTTIIQRATKHSNGDTALFRKEVLSQIDTNKNLSPVTLYNLAASKGVDAYSVSSRFKNTGLNIATLKSLVNDIPNYSHNMNNIPINNYYRNSVQHIRPMYRSKPLETPVVKKSPKGQLEQIYAQEQMRTPFLNELSKPFSTIGKGSGAPSNSISFPSSSTISALNSNYTKQGNNVVDQVVPITANTPKTSIAQSSPLPVAAPAPLKETHDTELEHLRRVTANYEHDKKMLAKEATPALTRSASHDVGHAVSSSKNIDGTEVKKTSSKLEQMVKSDLSKSM